MTPNEAIARAIGGYEPGEAVPEHDYVFADWIVRVLDDAGFKITPHQEIVA